MQPNHSRYVTAGTEQMNSRTARTRPARSTSATAPTRGAKSASAVVSPRKREANARPKSRYIPALDGLRTFAVAAVVIYHLDLPWAQGGLLGVTMFFVLSGYLITRLLLNELQQTKTIDLKGFWVRRIRRLMPACVAVVLVTIVLCAIFNHVMLTKMRPQILPSLFFFNNWFQIFQNTSYFAAVGDPSPLTHFWSLAIEEQFYLVWPPVLLVIGGARANRPAVRRTAFVLAAASAIAMMVLYNPAQDPTRVYYGTDTRAFSLLLGAWLAFIPEADMAPSRLLGRITRGRFGYRQGAANGNLTEFLATPASIDLVGVIGLVGLIAMVFLTNGYDSFQYRGGTLLCTVLTLCVIAACVQPEGLVASAFALPPLVWLGKRSYGIYLWHYPLLLLMNPVADITEASPLEMLVQVLIVVGVAEASYRFIETPFRKGAIGSFLSEMSAGTNSPRRWVGTHRILTGAVALVLVAAVGSVVLVPDTSALSKDGAELLQAGADSTSTSADTASTTNSGSSSNSSSDSKKSSSKKSSKKSSSKSGDDSASTSASSATSDADADSEWPEGSYDILMIGDSVSLRLNDIFTGTFKHGHIDALKSRQFDAGQQVYESYLQQNLCGKISVFALGTNGPVTDAMVDSLMNDVGTKRICVFVNTRSRTSWVSQTNQSFENAKSRYSNVRVVDWYGYSANRNDLFDGDGTHLNTKGAQEYLKLIYESVKDVLPFHLEDYSNDPVPSAGNELLNDLRRAVGKQTKKELKAAAKRRQAEEQ